jgi:hypothetical protein
VPLDGSSQLIYPEPLEVLDRISLPISACATRFLAEEQRQTLADVVIHLMELAR